MYNSEFNSMKERQANIILLHKSEALSQKPNGLFQSHCKIRTVAEAQKGLKQIAPALVGINCYFVIHIH